MSDAQARAVGAEGRDSRLDVASYMLDPQGAGSRGDDKRFRVRRQRLALRADHGRMGTRRQAARLGLPRDYDSAEFYVSPA